MMPNLRAVFALALLLPAVVQADEAYRLKLRKDKVVGDAGQVDETERTTQKTVVTDADGKVLQDTTKKTGRSVAFVETILALDGTKPARLSRKFTKANITEDDLEDAIPIVGKTALIDRKAPGKFEFSMEGGELPDRARKILADAFRNKEDEDRFNELVFGKDPIAVGATRKFEAVEVVKGLFRNATGIAFDEAKATGSIKLKEAYKKDGATFGKLTVEVSAPIAMVGGADKKFKAQDGSTFKLTMNMDACIDGSRTEGTVEGNLEMKVTAKLPANGMDVTLTQTVSSKLVEQRKMLAK